jgi:small subunit ribosomal protein S13
MARLLGVVLPDEKKIEYSLTLLYGIGFSLSKKILNLARIDSSKKTKELTEEELRRLAEIIEKNYVTEGELREKVNVDIQALKTIGCYRGIRHLRNLPVRGQRTRSNARTKRGKRKTIGALRKEVWAKIEQQQTKPKEKQ